MLSEVVAEKSLFVLRVHVAAAVVGLVVVVDLVVHEAIADFSRPLGSVQLKPPVSFEGFLGLADELLLADGASVAMKESSALKCWVWAC